LTVVLRGCALAERGVTVGMEAVSSPRLAKVRKPRQAATTTPNTAKPTTSRRRKYTSWDRWRVGAIEEFEIEELEIEELVLDRRG
jgi:hypothetical protein